MDGPSSIFLQVAEYRESSKCGSFMALSNSLGHILMQLHTGTWKICCWFNLFSLQTMLPFSSLSFCFLFTFFSASFLYDVGTLHLIQCETNSRLLVLVYKILMLLISCTPYVSSIKMFTISLFFSSWKFIYLYIYIFIYCFG